MSISRMIFSFNEIIRGRNTLKYFEELKRIQAFSDRQLKEFQFEKLKSILIHSFRYVDYYKDIFNKVGFNPERINSFEDFQKVPFLTKEDIRNKQDRFISKDKKRKLTRFSTAGSTGHPLTVFKSNDRIAGDKAAYLMLYDWWGIHICDREAVLWSCSRDISAYNIAKRIRNNLLNTHLLPAFNMNEKTMRRYIAFLQKYKPKNIFGYAHSIYLLARFAKNRNLNLKNIGTKVIFTTAEILHDFQRQLIEEVFSANVANCYGGRDLGLVAFECPRRNMHMNPDVITEFIEKGTNVKEGEKGEVVTTSLLEFGMPLIRYRTGDEGILSDIKDCDCGIKFPIVKKILGRNTDYIVSPKGEFIHPLALEYIFRELEGIDYFRIVQKKEDELEIDLVTNYKFDKSLEEFIKDRLCQTMGATVKVNLNFIKESEIKTENKYKFVVSEVIKKYL